MLSEQKVKITLVAGFLGAGKTTLINRMLSEGFGGERTAVIVNDFGKVAVDASLIERANEGMLVLRNGCICCSLAEDLMRGLAGMVAPERGLERIVMETSGVTTVGNLKTIFGRPGLAERLMLTRVIVVADAVRHAKIRKVVLVVDEQVRHADVILLNRCDAASQGERSAALEALREVNPRARLIQTEHCRVSLEEVLAAPGTSEARALTQPIGTPAELSADVWHSGRVLIPGPVGRESLAAALRRLPESIHRVKGFVTAPDYCLWHVEWAGGEPIIQSWAGTPSVSADDRDVLVAISSQPLAKALEESFAGIPGIKVIEDHAQHRHS